MVDGVNIARPILPGSNESGDVISQKKAKLQNKQAAFKEASQNTDNVKRSVSSAIGKSAEERVDALVSGNVAQYLKAAERFIDASLPSKPPGTRLRIDLDDSSGRFVYQGIDVNTGDVISQFPAEEILKYLSFIREREGAEGIVVDKEV